MKKTIIANWKNHPQSYSDAKRLFTGIQKSTSRTRSRIVVCPPLLYLEPLARGYSGSRLAFGAQDVSGVERETQTGAISASMIRRASASYVIVGHSERRSLGETNEIVALKLRVAIKAGLTGVLCVGERERDKDAEYLTLLKADLTQSLKLTSREGLRRVVIAYEPLWAIGKTARAAITPHDLHEMHIYIRKVLAELYGRKSALRTPILYGGSVEDTNARELLQGTDSAGLLVGHASLDPRAFGAIVRAADRIR